MSDDAMEYGAVLGNFIEHGSDAPKVETFAPKDWEVVNATASRHGTQYQLNTGVSLIHNETFDRIACMSCKSADRCRHCVTLRAYLSVNAKRRYA